MSKIFPKSILLIFIASWLYWGYLSMASSMQIVFDAQGFERLGKVIYEYGWGEFLRTGPHREPLFPAFIALSMSMADKLSINYQHIQEVIQLLSLASAQFLLWFLLRSMGVRNGLAIILLAYFSFSPAIVNSGLSLFSEICTYPLILGILLGTFILGEGRLSLRQGALLGLLSLVLVLAKGVFEIVIPVYIVGVGFLLWTHLKNDRRKMMVVLLLWLGIFLGGVHIWKAANYFHHGQYVLTDRGSFMIYGSAVRRTEPLKNHHILAAVTSVAGDKVCLRFFSQEECGYWAFQTTDGFGLSRMAKMQQEGVEPTRINSQMIHEAFNRMLHQPIRYVFFSFLEMGKMFFWESTQIGFVHYPRWLNALYEYQIVNNGLRLIVSVMGLVSVLSLTWVVITRTKIYPISISCQITLLLLWVFLISFSFVSVLTRYAFPIVPVYFLCVGYWLEQILYYYHQRSANV